MTVFGFYFMTVFGFYFMTVFGFYFMTVFGFYFMTVFGFYFMTVLDFMTVFAESEGNFLALVPDSSVFQVSVFFCSAVRQ